MHNPDSFNKVTKPVLCDDFNVLDLSSENVLKCSNHDIENAEKVMKLCRKSSRPITADFMSDLDHGRVLNYHFTSRNMKIAIDVAKNCSGAVRGRILRNKQEIILRLTKQYFAEDSLGKC